MEVEEEPSLLPLSQPSPGGSVWSEGSLSVLWLFFHGKFQSVCLAIEELQGMIWFVVMWGALRVSPPDLSRRQLLQPVCVCVCVCM